MTTITVPTTITAPAPSGHRLRWAFADTLTVTWRNLLAYTRIPEALFFSTLQPIMFVLLFRYVFGGAIPIPGGVPYVDYMMPGIFVQTVMFGAVSTAVGLSEDLQKGLIERFRALPMARSAVLGGRTTADAVRNVFVIAIMTLVGFAVGFRIGAGVPDFLLGALILLAFAYSMSWGFADHRAGRAEQRDGTGHGVPDLDAAHVRLHRVRADPVDARLAPGLRTRATGVGRRRRCPLTDGGRLLPLDQFGLVRAVVDRRVADRARAAQRLAIPQDQLARYSSPARRRSSFTRSLIGTRTCSVLSRSRTVTASSSSDSKSTVTHHGVPTSSWRR